MVITFFVRNSLQSYGVCQVNATTITQPDRLVFDLPTMEGWKAELTLVLDIYQHGLCVRRQSLIQVLNF